MASWPPSQKWVLIIPKPTFSSPPIRLQFQRAPDAQISPQKKSITPKNNFSSVSSPPPLPQAQAADNIQRKVAICSFYRKGICKHGSAGKECKFRHPKVCKKLVNHGNRGELGCKVGGKCTMFHPFVCRNSQRYMECLNEHCRFLHIKGTRRTAKEPSASTSSTR